MRQKKEKMRAREMMMKSTEMKTQMEPQMISMMK